jgi:5-methyltetrahydrofolate--homocysteine methyltransferase
MDGAMGTELQRAGIGAGDCYEAWNLRHPERVLAIHAAYVRAGAACLLTNTFQSNPVALARHGLEGQLEAINRAAVELARSAVGASGFVLGDIGPIDADEEAIRRTVRSFIGVDGLLLETYSDLPSALRVLDVCRSPTLARRASKGERHPSLARRANVRGQPTPASAADAIPVLVSFAYLRTSAGELRTHGGETPETVARAMEGVAALGVNCGKEIRPADAAEVVRRYREVTELALFARPNAGTPASDGGRWVYPLSAAGWAEAARELLAVGVAALGGCCGTTPAHIDALRAT